jgi:hypothetical protein
MTPKQVKEATELLQRHADLMAARERLASYISLNKILPVIVGRRIGADGSIEDPGARFGAHASDVAEMVAASITVVGARLRELGVESGEQANECEGEQIVNLGLS